MSFRVENLSKRFGSVWALRDVTFEVSDGEIFGIFGGTASGKTTLLRCLAGIDKVNGGSVSPGDVYLAGVPKGSGFPQLFGRRSTSQTDGEGRVADFRLALRQPKRITLFDEPFAGIDAVAREGLQKALRSFSVDERITIFASSDFEQVAAVCDRIAVIDKGEILQIGTPHEVYDSPASTAVAAAVGITNRLLARRLTSTNAAMPEFITIEGNHRLFAQPTETAKLGALNQNVTLAVHPEQLSISFGASFPEDNLLRAIVTGIRFRGMTTVVELDADGLKLEARVFRVVGLNVGDECMIAIPPDRIQVLKE